jgi:hypothetical protein
MSHTGCSTSGGISHRALQKRRRRGKLEITNQKLMIELIEDEQLYQSKTAFCGTVM